MRSLNGQAEHVNKIKSPLLRYLRRNWTLYSMILPGVALIFIFSYIPMYGVVISIQKFKPALGFFKSPLADPWFKYYLQLFQDPYFFRLLKNTLLLGIYTLLWTFPAPVIFALMLNEIKNSKFKRVVQTISYMPYFLSTVIVIGIMRLLLSTNGPMSVILETIGIKLDVVFLLPEAFRSLYIGSGLWMGLGYGSIIYLAAIAGINPEIYEAAIMDGANRFKQILYVTIPSIMPTVTILLIFSVAGIIGNDYSKIILMYNEATYRTADVFGTYVYRVGVAGESQSYAAAAGLFTSVVSFVLLMLTNAFARKYSETSLW